jgi:hypothetical protein
MPEMLRGAFDEGQFVGEPEQDARQPECFTRAQLDPAASSPRCPPTRSRGPRVGVDQGTGECWGTRSASADRHADRWPRRLAPVG